jgi:hypothetical protein
LDDSHAASLVAVSTEPDTGEGERLIDQDLGRIAKTLVAATIIQYPVRYVGINDSRWHENADFVAHARMDIPRLLQEIGRLRERQTGS